MLIALAAPAGAATSTWTAAGGTSDFSDAANWDAFPTPNCIMVFPAGAAFASKGAPVNNLIGQTIDQLNVSEAYVITGNAIVCKNINDNSAGTVNIALPISTAGSAVLTVTVTIAGATLNLSGKLTGAGPVSYSGPGNKRLNGTINNTLSGLSIVAQGFLVLDSTATEAISGPLQVDSGATARLVRAPAIKNSVVVTVNGTLDLSATTGSDGADTELIGGLAGTATAANISLGANTLGCTAQVAPTNYAGGFSGTGGFRQSTSGTEVLSGTAFPYTGTTRLAGGEMHIWGSLIGSPVIVTSGTLVLANDATVGATTLSGGASVLSLDETISAMTMHATTPSLTIGSGSTYLVVTKSPTNFARVSTAAVNVSGAVLSVDTSLFSPAPTSVMTIITNTGSSPVVGTFAGLAQGATVVSSTNSGTTFTISYVGGSGHDVTLTGVAAASDTTAPTISAISSGSITGNSATITWTTDEASTSQVEFGLTTAYGSLSTVNAALVLSHSVALSGLVGSTTYHFRVRSRDAAGNLATSADGTFATAADTTAPVASTITAGSITGTTAVITWTTNEASDSQVEFGTTTAYGTTTTLDTSLVTNHSVTVSGLTISTLYHFRVLSRDGSGNLVTSADGTFTTTDGTVPVASTSSGHHCGGGSVFGFLMVTLMLSLRLHRRGRILVGARSQPHA
ncbi:MAG: fibronectin type III domain-containing protein [Planctomycetes bacterium]|nr:fibronectin type III domain-containing protein [Planctomycetota bacterium]